MKTYILKSILAAFFLFIGVTAFSQDKIYKTNDDVIICTITEIGEDVVKYTSDETGAVVYVLDKDKIVKIVFANGKVMTFVDSFNDPEIYAKQRKSAYKIGLFSPLTGALSLGYERSIKPGRSVEGSIGFIGIGRDDFNVNAQGAFLKTGYKFIMTPDFKMRGMKYSHILKGWYFRPELDFAYYQKDNYNYDPITGQSTSYRADVVAGALMLNFGKQIVMSDIFLVDFFVGMGYGFDNQDNDYYYEGNGGNHYGFIVGQDFPIAFTSGFKIGFLTK